MQVLAYWHTWTSDPSFAVSLAEEHLTHKNGCGADQVCKSTKEQRQSITPPYIKKNNPVHLHYCNSAWMTLWH